MPVQGPILADFQGPGAPPGNVNSPLTRAPFPQHQLLSPRKSIDQIKPKMAPPSQLTISTGAVQRLVKEESSYHKELKSQEARLEKLLGSKDEDENAEYQLKQEVRQPFYLMTCSILQSEHQ